MNIFKKIYFWKNTSNIITKNIWNDLKPLDPSKLKNISFPDNQYFKEEYKKTQIIIHHTISGDGVNGDINSWEATPEKIAVCIIIDRNGIPYQLFSSKYWAYHLGCNNTWLDRHSIGVELDNWGGLILGDGTNKLFDNPPKNIKTEPGKFYSYYGNIVNVPIQQYYNNFRGYYYFERYTIDQIKTLGELILYWNLKYNIPLTYNENMWDISQEALGGKPGIWSHISYRKDKSDCHPQPELIEMLKSLSNLNK